MREPQGENKDKGLDRKLTRRQVLRFAVLGGVSAAVSACAGPSSPQTEQVTRFNPEQPKSESNVTYREIGEIGNNKVRYHEKTFNLNNIQAEQEPHVREGFGVFVSEKVGVYELVDKETSQPRASVWANVDGRSNTIGESWHQDQDINKTFLWKEFGEQVALPMLKAQIVIQAELGDQTMNDVIFGNQENAAGGAVPMSTETGGGIVMDTKFVEKVAQEQVDLRYAINVLAHESAHLRFNKKKMAPVLNEATTDAFAMWIMPRSLEAAQPGADFEDFRARFWQEHAISFARDWIQPSTDRPTVENMSTDPTQTITNKGGAETYAAAIVPYMMLKLAGIGSEADSASGLPTFIGALETRMNQQPDGYKHISPEIFIETLKKVGSSPEKLPDTYMEVWKTALKGLLIKDAVPEIEELAWLYRDRINAGIKYDPIKAEDETTIVSSAEGRVVIRSIEGKPGQKYKIIQFDPEGSKTGVYGWFQTTKENLFSLEEGVEVEADENGKIGKVAYCSNEGEKGVLNIVEV